MKSFDNQDNTTAFIDGETLSLLPIDTLHLIGCSGSEGGVRYLPPMSRVRQSNMRLDATLGDATGW